MIIYLKNATRLSYHSFEFRFELKKKNANNQNQINKNVNFCDNVEHFDYEM